MLMVVLKFFIPSNQMFLCTGGNYLLMEYGPILQYFRILRKL